MRVNRKGLESAIAVRRALTAGRSRGKMKYGEACLGEATDRAAFCLEATP